MRSRFHARAASGTFGAAVFRLGILGCAILGIALVGCGAQEIPPMKPAPSATTTPKLEVERAELARANPDGVTLTVATKGDRVRFAEGEPIELELRFASRVPDAYQLDLGTYDRSGRLWSESFRFEPAERVVDPLADFFGEVRGGLGGIRPMPKTLSPEPETVRVVLNEWARFAGPGTYRFFVQSTRVFVTTESGGTRTVEERTVTSENVLELEIVTDAAFAAKALAEVTAALDAAKDEDTVRDARRKLRFLTTDAAADAMVDDLCRTRKTGDDYRFQTQAGLYGSPDRAGVIRRLRAGLARPACAISGEYVELLTRLEAAGTQGEARGPALDAARVSITRALIEALPSKSDEARPLSIFTALGATSARSASGAPAGPEAAALRESMAEHLGKLPDDALAQLLGDSWPLVESPAIAPALRAIATEARPRGGRLRSLSDLALERWIEVDYDAARAFILAELGRVARPSFTGATLGLLKDPELPALDAALVRGLTGLETDGVSLELHAEVFARYASKARVKEAWAAYRAIPYFRVSLLSYLLRHDPKAAEKELAALPGIDDLSRLARVMWSAPLEAAVIAKLDGRDATQAATLLGERGGPAAEKALSRKLDALRGKKGGRDDAIVVRRALTHGNGWMLTPPRLLELAARCEDAACKRDVGMLVDRWGDHGTHPTFVIWSTPPSGGVTGWLGHYDFRTVEELARRIAQLPEGTTLVWQTAPSDVDPAVWADVEKWAAARRVVIAPQPAP